MTKTHEITATIRRWTDKNGAKHSATLIVGAVFRSTKGNQVMKLDAWPLSSDFSGWLAIKPCAGTEDPPEPCAPALPAGRRVSPGMPPAPAPEDAPATDEDNDIPF